MRLILPHTLLLSNLKLHMLGLTPETSLIISSYTSSLNFIPIYYFHHKMLYSLTNFVVTSITFFFVVPKSIIQKSSFYL